MEGKRNRKTQNVDKDNEIKVKGRSPEKTRKSCIRALMSMSKETKVVFIDIDTML